MRTRNIIIIVVVIAIIVLALPALIALFTLGVFGSGNSLPNACIAESGFICSSISYSNNGVVAVNIGQATGQSWNNTQVALLNATQLGGNVAVPADIYNAFNTSVAVHVAGGLQSGGNTRVTLPVRGGKVISGLLYAKYTLTGSTTPYYAEVAVITAMSK